MAGRSHICQCLNRLSTIRGNSTVTIAGERRKTGQQFVESVLGLADKLSQLGVSSGHVVAICAYNRFVFCHHYFLNFSVLLFDYNLYIPLYDYQ